MQSEASPVHTLSPLLSAEKSARLEDVQRNALAQLEACCLALSNLAAFRLECKLSNTRVAGVARELNELRKVMSVYA